MSQYLILCDLYESFIKKGQNAFNIRNIWLGEFWNAIALRSILHIFWDTSSEDQTLMSLPAVASTIAADRKSPWENSKESRKFLHLAGLVNVGRPGVGL